MLLGRKIPIYQVDAFSSKPFAGNPAAVCPLDHWLPDATLHAIAAENNLSETAFFVPEADGFRLRWFTPQVEVDLCGHATLASAFILMARLGWRDPQIRFYTHSGLLTVAAHEDGRLVLDFPARPPQPLDPLPGLAEALGASPLKLLVARDLICVLPDAESVRRLTPAMDAIAALPFFAVIATAPGTGADGDVDFVSRFFAPAKGVPEDPVTGSAHCSLIPYWADRLGRGELRARQVSPRGGELWCRMVGARVEIAGYAVLVIEGEFHL